MQRLLRRRRRHWAQQRHHLFICQSVSLWFLWNNSYQHSTACAGCRSKKNRKISRRRGCFVSLRLTAARSARLQLWEFLRNASCLVIAETGLSLRPRVAAWLSSSPLCSLQQVVCFLFPYIAKCYWNRGRLEECVCVCGHGEGDKVMVLRKLVLQI